MTDALTIPKSITIFGHEVRLRGRPYGCAAGRLGVVEVLAERWCGKPCLRLDTRTMHVARVTGKTFDAAARKAEKLFLKAAAKRINQNVNETTALRAALRKFGGAK